jgi:hypothetical protein
MEVIYIRTARSIWLVDIRDLNPRGLSLYPVMAVIRDRYKFQKSPKTAEEFIVYSQQGVVFSDGAFAVGDQEYAVKLTVYGDGFVVDTAVSTEISDLFLEDLLGFVSTQFGLTYRPNMIHKKNYASELIVKIAEPFRRVFAGFVALTDRLNTIKGEKYQPLGFSIGANPHLGAARPADFRLERELGKPIEQDRYYSLAPLQTKEHIELLRDFEKTLA